MGKINTPEWIVEGYDSPAEWKKSKGIKEEPKAKKPKPSKENKSEKKIPKKSSSKSDSKKFKIRVCPKCDSDNVKVVVGEEAKGLWKCEDCKWKGRDINEKELSEEELIKYLDKEK